MGVRAILLDLLRAIEFAPTGVLLLRVRTGGETACLILAGSCDSVDWVDPKRNDATIATKTLRQKMIMDFRELDSGRPSCPGRLDCIYIVERWETIHGRGSTESSTVGTMNGEPTDTTLHPKFWER